MNKIKLLQNLAKVKSEIGKVSKDSTNPFFKSKYFDINSVLEHVEPLLQKYGLVLFQPIENNKVRTEIFNVEDGEFIFSEMELPNLQDPQKLGSAITYFRRYTLQSLLGLQAEDDDANKASVQTTSNKEDDKPWLNVGAKEWVSAINKGSDLNSLRKYFKISKANATQYEIELNKKTS
jgi:hypothetical protein